MRPPPSRIWYHAAARIARQTAIFAFSDHQQKVLDYLWENFPGLYLGSPYETHPKETILDISRELSKNVAASQKRQRFDFLARGFEQGNLSLLGWDVPLGPVYFKINREENFSRQDRFRPIAPAEDFIQAFSLSLESPYFSDRKILLGQLLVSAILFGGLLHRKWLRPFQESVQERRYYQEGATIWIEMVVNDSVGLASNNAETAGQLTRRLVPDHLTRLLLYRYHRLGKEVGHQTVARDPWNNILAFIQGCSIPKSVAPASLSELYAWAFARYITLLPHSLVAYACGKLEGQSLPIGSWLRAVSGMAIPVSKSQSGDWSEKAGLRPRIKVLEGASKSNQQQLLSDLLKSLRFNKKTSKTVRGKSQVIRASGKISPQRAGRIITEYMHHNRARMSATLQLLLHWALSLLREKISHLERRQKRSMRVTSVDRYLLSVGYALLYAAGDLPLHELEPQDLAVVYEEVTLRLGKNRYALQRLRQYHGFMEAYYGVQTMEWDDVTGAKPQSAVSANAITFDVYRAVLKALGWGQADLTRWQKLHIITVILLYRCGLRPSEVQALRLKDVQGVTQYEILIRNSRLNTIKTNAGIRRVPVSSMLHNDELELVLDYYKMRLDEDPYFGRGLLLAHPAHLEGLLSDEELFVPVRDVLRTITLDEGLRLYHLRHSLLTWVNAALLLDQSRNTVQFSDIVIPPDDQDRISCLFRQLYGNEDTGRKGMYLLAMVAGHASPHTTFEHYCHLQDAMLGHHLNAHDASTPVNYRMVMALTGLQRSAVYDLLSVPDGIHQLHNVVANEVPKFRNELRHPMMEKARPMREPKRAPHPKSSLPSWEEAIGSILDNGKLAALRRAKGEWDYAAAMYEAVRGLDGRRMKTAVKVVAYVRQHYSERHGGIGITLQSQARQLIDFLSDKGIPESHVVAIFHPAKRLTLVESEEARKHWAHILGISTSRISTGEFVPAKLNVRSTVTMKISVNQISIKKARTPKMSLGFMIAMEMLYHSFLK